MNSKFYERVIKIEDENQKILLNNMSNFLDKSINDFIEKRKRDVYIKKYDEKSKSKKKEDIDLLQNENNGFRIFSIRRYRNQRIIRTRNMIRSLEEES